MTLAKSLCGGIAGGALIARRNLAASLKPGTHASTFGGNPIAAAAGIAMIETIEQDGLLEQCESRSQRFAQHLKSLQDKCPHIKEIRQAGMMIGIELSCEGAPIVAKCLEQGLLINCTQGNVLRLLPALNIELDQIDQAMEILVPTVAEIADQLVPSESSVS
jgi:acetylornithine/succinyldiaminopimelate/putrescine aminotransferase